MNKAILQLDPQKISNESTDKSSIFFLQPYPGHRAIEDVLFPFENLSDIAESESWRKEINRPLTHIHKWWAQRLGTVFRALVIGTFAPSGSDILDLFYKPIRFSEGIVFDPFMGSGTTLAETLKVGARAIGRDINPVAYLLVKCALSFHDRNAIIDTFRDIERDVAAEICSYYSTILPGNLRATVLYYFWVKSVECPACNKSVDLFSSQIFARHAYPKKVPHAHAICPHCKGINKVHVDAHDVCCSSCMMSFDPSGGPVKGQNATCPFCNHTFPIAKTIRSTGKPPAQRMYAKLILLPDGSKAYYAITDDDLRLYADAEDALKKRKNAFPMIAIAPGYNTNQVLGHNYRYWHEMFNARQLLCLSILSNRIRDICDPLLRELFTCLFSGILEFNNMFASYKGEGTGAVRHMFAHHILKPERVPLEANLWGTPKSSGSFSTLFESRILRALNYDDNPFELRINCTKVGHVTDKVYGLSEKISTSVAETFQAFAEGKRVYISCGDSSIIDLPDKSVDAIITDPPFFDNVHYSQLADFFHVWQRHILGTDRYYAPNTTRSDREVQNAEEDVFANRLASVWLEGYRILKDDGLLVFTYHHSRAEGWRCLLYALMKAKFVISAVHPVKGEMSVALPKLQAKEPIDLDIILVCRKYTHYENGPYEGIFLENIATSAIAQVDRFRVAGRYLSRNDVRIIIMAQLLMQASRATTLTSAMDALDNIKNEIESIIDYIYKNKTTNIKTNISE